MASSALAGLERFGVGSFTVQTIPPRSAGVNQATTATSCMKWDRACAIYKVHTPEFFFFFLSTEWVDLGLIYTKRNASSDTLQASLT